MRWMKYTPKCVQLRCGKIRRMHSLCSQLWLARYQYDRTFYFYSLSVFGCPPKTERASLSVRLLSLEVPTVGLPLASSLVCLTETDTTRPNQLRIVRPDTTMECMLFTWLKHATTHSTLYGRSCGRIHSDMDITDTYKVLFDSTFWIFDDVGFLCKNGLYMYVTSQRRTIRNVFSFITKNNNTTHISPVRMKRAQHTHTHRLIHIQIHIKLIPCTNTWARAYIDIFHSFRVCAALSLALLCFASAR